jgi:succinate dehydrogenase hydrophobic anchor subunit
MTGKPDYVSGRSLAWILGISLMMDRTNEPNDGVVMNNPVLNLLSQYSYKEKSILISLLTVSGAYGSYFYNLLNDSTEHSMRAMAAAMLGIVVTLVVVHIVFHVVISLDDVSEDDDERDRAVNRRASVFGYNILFLVTMLVAGRLVIAGAWAETTEIASPTLFEIANLLLAGLVASEVIYYAAQLVFYRRHMNG